MKNLLELKKWLLSIFLCAFLINVPVFAGQINQSLFESGVDKYRQGESLECLNIMNRLKKEDPSNSYVIYYSAMSNAKLGHLEKAKHDYEQVIFLNHSQELVSYAKQGIKNIKIALSENENAVDQEPEHKWFWQNDKKTDAPPDMNKKNDKKVVKKEPSDKKNSDVSDEEVAKAIRTLKKAGLLNVQVGVNGSANMTPASMMQNNSELMNLSLMMGSMGGNSKGSGMDMLPMLMMQQQQQGKNGKGTAISPEIIQMMMNNSMLDGLSTFDMNDKDK